MLKQMSEFRNWNGRNYLIASDVTSQYVYVRVVPTVITMLAAYHWVPSLTKD